MKHEHNRGTIKESIVKAMVTSTLYRLRTEQNDKGKGSYRRKAKHHKDFRSITNE